MNKTGLFFIFIIAGNCANAQKTCLLKILDATIESHIGGVMGSPQQQFYSLKVIVKPKYKIVFDTLWIKQAALPVKSRTGSGDTAWLSAVYTRTDPGFLRQNNQPVPPEMVKAPKKLEGQALLGYKLNHKQYFLQIKEFRKLETIAYPSAPPIQNR
jgi:hypothetical protein